MAEFVKNCRNVHEIARLVRRHLDDARAPMVGPAPSAWSGSRPMTCEP